MSTLNLEPLTQAFSQFSKMYHHYKNNLQNEGSIEQEAIKESLVQRFEYTIELSWKTIARYLTDILGLEVVKAPKPILREAGKLEILETENWITFINSRNQASHKYDEATLDSILENMDVFYIHAKSLIEYLETQLKIQE